jgi:hypothetical protein
VFYCGELATLTMEHIPNYGKNLECRTTKWGASQIVGFAIRILTVIYSRKGLWPWAPARDEEQARRLSFTPHFWKI